MRLIARVRPKAQTRIYYNTRAPEFAYNNLEVIFFMLQ